MATFNNVDTFEELRDAITASKTNGQADTINITGNITLSADLPTILADSTGLTINGGNFTLNGDNARRILFIKSGTVNLSGLNFSNGRAQGASASGGGGGNAGMGGALFIYGGNVTISNATFANNRAIGGSAAGSFGGIGLEFLSNPANFGGTGADGTLTSPNGVKGGDGGYGGRGGNGGDGYRGDRDRAAGNAGNAGNGGFAGAGGKGGTGGYGGSGVTLDRAGIGGGRGGNGGNGGFGAAGGAGGDGGPGGAIFFGDPNDSPTPGGDGGNGGFGGFGGAGGVGGKGGKPGKENDFAARPKGDGGNGGNGGYGAGGGRAGIPFPDTGIFGTAAEDEGFVGIGGQGGFGGGSASPGGYQFDQPGQNVPNPISGGGAGMGGAIFIRSGSLSLNTVAFNSNSTAGGTGYENGKGYGGAIFAMKSTTNSNGNNQGMPTVLPTVSLSRVTFSGNNAGDATGTATPGTIGSNIDYSNDDLYGKTFTEINNAPTGLSFSNAVPSLPENTSTTSRVRVADIVVTDDGVGTNTLSLTGADAAAFEIISNVLYLKAGTALNFETKPSYSVTVNVNDPTVGGNPDASAAFTLPIGNVNEAPTAVNFSNTTTAIDENSDTTNRIKLADITITDDALGTNNLSLIGPDAASFEISGTTLYLKANTALDFETKPSYSVTVAVDDPTVGSNPDASRTFTLNLVDGADFLPFLVTNTNNSGIGSLRWAISNANRTAGTETIEFDPSLSGQTIDLSGGALQLTGSMNIDGDIDNDGTADITVDALSSSRVIEVSANQTVTIEGMVLQGGLEDNGGGIFNSGNLTLLNSTVRNNVSLANLGRGGGGIYNNGVNSVLILLNSTVSGNRTNRLGGGIHNDQGQVTIANSRIENNTGNVGGGGFYNFSGFSSLRGIITINDSTIESNSGSLGGGLVNDNGRITLNNSSLLNNTAGDTRSGAIFNQDDVLGEGAVVTLNGSVVSGGVYGNTINNGARGLLVINGTVNGETLQGSQGVDQISGLEGDDLLQGFQGSDTLIGGDGNDVVNGGDNNDLLQGGAGNDRLGGLGGTDRMEGGTGNDVYTVNNAAATLVEGVGEGNDTVRSEISWSLGSNFENLTLLGTGNLNGTGNDINNTLTGNSGANSLEGQSGNDRLIGNGGDDVLIGGAGADTVTGGGGNDRFVFNAISDGGDRITDFTANSDRIGVSAAGFGAGLSVGALLASQFAIGSLTTTDQRFLYDTSTGALFFDSNGSGAGGRTRIATLTTKPTLSASDIAIGV